MIDSKYNFIEFFIVKDAIHKIWILLKNFLRSIVKIY